MIRFLCFVWVLCLVAPVVHARASWLQAPAAVWESILSAQQPLPKQPEQAPRADAPAIVLIIDDLGNDRKRGRAVVNLPGRLTIAVLPFTPFGSSLAQAAQAVGKEVMLHAPMANLGGLPLGRGALTPDMTEAQFRKTLAAAISDIPFVQGVNNHMGSKLTTLDEQMHWVMSELKRLGLFFVDSRTNHLTVAAKTAAEMGVPHLSRHVFLDNERNAAAIDKAFNKLIKKAREEGLAVGIGHPYPETTSYLEKAIPKLERQGFVLLTVTEALER